MSTSLSNYGGSDGYKFYKGTSSPIPNQVIIDSDNVTEGTTNLYFTNTRARSAISASGSLSYDSATGVVSYTHPSILTNLDITHSDDSTVGSAKSIKAYVDAQILTKDNLDEIAEGTTNLHFTATDNTKLDGIETAATADQTGAQIKTAYEAESDTNAFTDADETKLDGIESSATADQTDAEIRTAVEAATDSNVFTDADHTKLDAIEASADVTDATNVTAAGALMDSELTDLAGVKGVTISTLQSKPSEGAFADGDKTKLDGVAASANNYAISSDLLDEDNMATDSATKVPSQQSVKAYVDSQVESKDALSELSGTLDDITAGSTNVHFTATDNTKLDGIEASATADQTGAQIKTAYEGESDTNAFTDADHTKLDGIETAADVTDATNVTAAGALMDSEVTNLADVKAFDTTDYATAAQGTTADAALAASAVSTFGGTLIDDADAAAARTTLGVDASGTDNSTDVTLANTNYLSLSSQEITGGTVPHGSGGTGLTSLGTAGQILKVNSGATALEFADESGGGGGGSLDNVSEDSSPQLGGDLDVNGNKIVTTSNGDIVLEPDGTGGVGIGTDSPTGAKLDIRTDSTTIIDAGATLNIEENTAWTQGIALYLNDADTYNANYASACIGVANNSSSLILSAGARNIASPSGSDGFKTLNTATPSVYRQSGGSHIFYSDTGKSVNTAYTPTERVRISADGSVGIGRTPTTRKLEVEGDILSVSTGTAAMIRIEAAGTQTTVGTAANSGAHLSLLNTTDTDDVFSRVDFLNSNEVSYAQIVGQATSQDDRKGELAFLTSDNAAPAEAMRIDSDGNVGIGHDDPDSILHLDGGATTQLTMGNSSAGDSVIMFKEGSDVMSLSYDGGDNKLYIRDEDADVPRVTFEREGNVGIGTTSPATGLTLDVAGKIGTIGGNAAAPSHTFNDDVDTGMYRDGSNGIGFSTGGTNRVSIDSSGYCGFGITSPSERIEAWGNIKSNGGNGQGFVLNSTTTTGIFRQNGDELGITVGGSERMRIDNSGFVGIGTDAPSDFHSSGQRLVVGDGAGDEGISIYSGSDSSGTINFADASSGAGRYVGRIIYDHSANDMHFSTNGSTWMTIDDGGSIGLGTTSPTFSSGGGLHVSNASRANVKIETGSNSCEQFIDGTDFYLDHGPAGAIVFRNDTRTERMRIGSSGNVGIALNDPSAVLEVSGGTNTLGIIRMTQRVSGAAAYGLDMGLDASTGDPVFSRIVNDTVSEAIRIVRSDGDVSISQNLGIGTAAPTAKLDCQGNAKFNHSSSNLQVDFTANNSTILNFTNGTSEGTILRTDEYFRFDTGGSTERMRIGSSGQVSQPVYANGAGEAITIDFDKSNLQTITLDGSEMELVLDATNHGAGKTVKVMIDYSQASLSEVDVSSTSWSNHGGDPTSLNGYGYMILNLTSWTGSDSGVTAEWQDQIS